MFKFLILIALFIFNFFVILLIPKYLTIPSIFIIGNMFISFFDKKWRYSIINMMIIILVDLFSYYLFGVVSASFLTALLFLYILENTVSFEKNIKHGVIFTVLTTFVYYIALTQLNKIFHG